ncbi:MAG: protein phosphatase 2C domain-containing protein [Petrotogales bacterium]
MNSDSCFVQGHSHSVCEDYVISNERVNGDIVGDPFVVLCDGCSSSPNTDIGARLLAIAAMQSLDILDGQNAPTLLFCHAVYEKTHSYCRSMSISEDCLLSTLIVVKYIEESRVRGFNVIMFGDGAIATQRKTGSRIDVETFEYTSGAPYYLNYHFNEKKKQQYYDNFGLSILQNVYHLNPGQDTAVHYVKDRLINRPPDVPFIWCRFYSLDDISMIAVMSDGIKSFIDLSKGVRSNYDIVHVLSSILFFRATNGVFVKRRMKKGLKKMEKEKKIHEDDISIGVIVR